MQKKKRFKSTCILSSCENFSKEFRSLEKPFLLFVRDKDKLQITLVSMHNNRKKGQFPEGKNPQTKAWCEY